MASVIDNGNTNSPVVLDGFCLRSFGDGLDVIGFEREFIFHEISAIRKFTRA
jgi:hypothetical protein